MKVLNDRGLVYQVQKIKEYLQTLMTAESTARSNKDTELENNITQINSDISDINTALESTADAVHTHTSADVTLMTGYTKGSSSAAITTTDTLNKAIGKLEKGKAALASPTFTGTPKAPTATEGTNTTQISTTAFVQTAVTSGVNGVIGDAPNNLNSLEKLADAINNDPNFSSTIGSQINGKLDASSANYIKSIGINGNTLTYTNGDNTTGTITLPSSGEGGGGGGATYDAMTANDISTKTSTTAMVISPSILTDYVEGYVADEIGDIDTGVMSVTTGSTNGTINVDGTAVSVYGLDTGAFNPKYTHPTTAGNKHIPSGGSSGQVLKYSSSGTATWGTITGADAKMTGYTKGSSSSSISATDTINQAFGKLENMLDDKVSDSELPTLKIW